MFGLGRISQKPRHCILLRRFEQRIDDDVQDETSKDDDAERSGALEWSNQTFIEFIGLLILLMTALAPISIATYFFAQPERRQPQ